MKDMRIFIGSSKELEKERNYLSYLTVACEESFARRDLHVTLSKWEYVDPALTHTPTEERYLQEMLNSDLALIIYWKFLGKWTKLESDTAHKSIADNNVRLKRRTVLYKENFAAGEAPCPELQEWKELHREEDSFLFCSMPALGVQFLNIIDSYQHAGAPLLRIENDLIKCDDFTVARVDECPEDLVLKIQHPPMPTHVLPQLYVPVSFIRTITAFLAADEEINDIRDLLADMSLELNEKWKSQNVKFSLRFYSPAMKEKLLSESDLALIIYKSKIGDFDQETAWETYEKFDGKCYIFFQDIDNIPPGEFLDFKSSFTEKLGQFTSSFRETDTIRYKFAMQIAPAFLTYDKSSGNVMLGDYPIAEMNKLTMLANHAEFAEFQKNASDIAEAISQTQSEYEKHPENKDLFTELYKLRKKQEDNEQSIEQLKKSIFNLSQSIALLDAQTQKSKILEMERLLEAGKTEELTELLADNINQLSQAVSSYEQKKKELRESAVKEVRFHADMEMIRINAYLLAGKSSYLQDADTVFRFYTDLCRILEQDEDFLEILADIRSKFSEFCESYSTLDSKFVEERKKLLSLLKENYQQLQINAEKENDQTKAIRFAAAAAKTCRDHACQLNDLKQYSEAGKEIERSLQLLRKIVKNTPGYAEDLLADALRLSAAIYFESNQKGRIKNVKLAFQGFNQTYTTPDVRKKTIAVLQEALDLCASGKSKTAAEIHDSLGDFYLQNREYEKAEQEYQQNFLICQDHYNESLILQKDKKNKIICMGIEYSPELEKLISSHVKLANIYSFMNEYEKSVSHWQEAMAQCSALLAARPQNYGNAALYYLAHARTLRRTARSGRDVDWFSIRHLLTYAEVMFEQLSEADFEKYCIYLHNTQVELLQVNSNIFQQTRDEQFRGYTVNTALEIWQFKNKIKKHFFLKHGPISALLNFLFKPAIWIFLQIFRKYAKKFEAVHLADRYFRHACIKRNYLKQPSQALIDAENAEKIIVPLCKNEAEKIFYKTFYADILKEKYYIYYQLNDVDKALTTLDQYISLLRTLADKETEYKYNLAISLEEYGLLSNRKIQSSPMGVLFKAGTAGQIFFEEALKIHQELSDEAGILRIKDYLTAAEKSDSENTLFISPLDNFSNC